MKRDIHELSSKDPQAARSLRYSFWDGFFASGMNGFTADYFTPFLLLLGGTARLVGIMNAFMNLFAALIQMKSADLTAEAKSRKKIFTKYVFLQACMLLPMVILSFLRPAPVFVFIGFVILFASFNSIAGPAWSSMMSDLVTQERRGRYFGWRNKVLGLIAVAASFLAGFILQASKKVNVYLGFALVFGLAFIFRLVSWYFLTKMHEPALSHRREDQFTLKMFISRFKESNFAKFVLFVALMNFSVNIAAPFFAVLMIRDLHFNYILYASITVTAALTLCLANTRWGRIADRIGNLKILKITAPLIAVVPLMWILNRDPAFLFFAQIFSGFAWAGFNLCASNFIYDAVTPEKRTRCIMVFNLFNGVALFLGGLLGGFLLPILPRLLGYKILSLLLISSALRIAVSLYMPRHLKEVRQVERVSNKDLLLDILSPKTISN